MAKSPRGRTRLLKAGVPLAGLAALGAALLVPSFGGASSHREAPALLEDPTADTTDLYFFRSPERPDTATLIANWIPFEEPHGGPNFYLFSENARYNLNIDQTGDGKWDLRYQYRFETDAPESDAAGYLYSDPSGNVLVKQTYDLYEIRRGAKTQVSRRIAKDVPVAPNNTGPKSLPGYAQLRAGAVTGLKNGIRTFAGQADDPFFVDLGMVFDLVNLDKPGRAGIGTGNQGGGVDSLARYNVHSIALQVPISTLRGKGKKPVVGAFASTERPVQRWAVKASHRMVRGVRVKTEKTRSWTEWRQVSRLGNPLVNEVLIPRYLKDRWNASDPSNDKKFAKYYEAPFPAAALNALFPSLNLNIPEKGRKDVAAALLNGLDLTGLGLADNSTGTVQADLLRLNLDTPVSADPKPFGEIQGDPQGFPNGRRLADDVVDIELRVIGGNLFNLVGGQANSLPLGDGVNRNDVDFETTFPYVAPASDGFSTAPPHYRTEPAAPPVGPLP